MKITKRRRKKPSGPNGEWTADDFLVKTEFVGTVPKTCRFRGKFYQLINRVVCLFQLLAMADFQYLVNPNDPMYKLKTAMLNFDGEFF